MTDARLVRTADLPDGPDFDQRQIVPLLELVRPIYTLRLGEVASDFDLSTEGVRNCFAVEANRRWRTSSPTRSLRSAVCEGWQWTWWWLTLRR